MRRALVALTIAVGLTLTGCATTTGTGTEPAGSTPATAPTPTETETPGLVAETPVAVDPSEADYIESVRELLPARTQIPDATDDQLVAVGWEACKRIANGETSDTIVLIDGEKPNKESGLYLDSVAIMTAAVRTLCP